MQVACTHLISGASAVSLVPRPEDWTRLLSSSLRSSQAPPSSALCRFSVPECWAGSVNEARETTSAAARAPCLAFSFVLTQPVFFLLCCFNGAAHCQVRFYVSLSGSSVVCEVFRGSLREHDCAISMTPKASLCELPHQLPLKFTL